MTNQARIFEDDVFLTTGTRDGDDDCPSQSPEPFSAPLAGGVTRDVWFSSAWP